MSFDSFVIERWLRDRDAFVAAADQLGAEVNVQNASGDVEEQIEQIRYLIKNRWTYLLLWQQTVWRFLRWFRKSKAPGFLLSPMTD